MHRLLFVTPVAPDAAAMDGGSRVMAELIEQLALSHVVGLVYFRGDGDPELGALGKVCDVVLELPRGGPWMRKMRVAGGLMMQRPFWASRWWSPQNAERLRGAVELWQPDVVQFEYHVTGQYAGTLNGLRPARVLVEHEPGVVASAGDTGQGGPLRRLHAAVESRAWSAYERRIYRHVDRIVVFTESDRDAIRHLAGDTTIVRIPFATRIPDVPLSAAGTDGDRILFVGNFRHYPNVDAALRLVRDIFPLVRARLPAAKLTFVGPDPPEELRASAGESVDVLGAVPDVAPYLDSAAVVAAPLRLGGGMRVKVLDALAAGKALVCTPRAVEGFSVRDREHVRTAESDADFARAIVHLLSNPHERIAMAGRAHVWARAHAGSHAVVTQYEALYDRIAPADQAFRQAYEG